jgi:hypothetical protein
MIPAHVILQRFDLPVPLPAILAGAVTVVLLSFLLIYILPTPERKLPSSDGDLPWIIHLVLRLVGLSYLVFLLLVALLGRQVLVLNASSILFWVWTIPLLPISNAILGGTYFAASPYRTLALLIRKTFRIKDSLVQDSGTFLQKVGYWPVVIQLLVLVWLELAFKPVANSPYFLGLLILGYTLFQVLVGVLLGEDWFGLGEVWQVLCGLASNVALFSIVEDQGSLFFQKGTTQNQMVLLDRGREALITLWLAGVLADGIRATPLWDGIVTYFQPQSLSITAHFGAFAGIDLGDLLLDSSEILVTWFVFGIFFVIFSFLASWLGKLSFSQVTKAVSLSLVPISLAYLFAHSFTQIMVIGPLVFQAAAANVDATKVYEANKHILSPGIIWWLQVGAIVLGHIMAVYMAHHRIREVQDRKSLALNADLAWLFAMLIYTATSLWVLAQPITNAP